MVTGKWTIAMCMRLDGIEKSWGNGRGSSFEMKTIPLYVWVEYPGSTWGCFNLRITLQEVPGKEESFSYISSFASTMTTLSRIRLTSMHFTMVPKSNERSLFLIEKMKLVFPWSTSHFELIAHLCKTDTNCGFVQGRSDLCEGVNDNWITTFTHTALRGEMRHSDVRSQVNIRNVRLETPLWTMRPDDSIHGICSLMGRPVAR